MQWIKSSTLLYIHVFSSVSGSYLTAMILTPLQPSQNVDTSTYITQCIRLKIDEDVTFLAKYYTIIVKLLDFMRLYLFQKFELDHAVFGDEVM